MRFNALIRQKTALALSAGLGGFVTMANLASAQLWNPCAPTGPRLAAYHNTWQTVATSADGTKLVAGGGVYDNDCNFCGSRWSGDAIYFSTNGGATWKASGPTDIWQAIASSADGTKLVAVAQAANGSGGIYTSTNSGLTWTAWTNMPANVWSAVASSSDGTRLFAVAGLQIATQWLQGDGSIYTSTNSGATWTRTSAPTNDWTAVASSADGTRLIAAAQTNFYDFAGHGDGFIYLSSDAGATWAAANAPSNNWASVASSADGTRLVAAEWWQGPMFSPLGGGAIYKSTNSGTSWTLTAAPDQEWSAVASSADGTILVAASAWIYLSRDSGSTWTLTGAPGDGNTVALSADGSRAVAGGFFELYTLPYSGAWRLSDMSLNSWTAAATSADGSKVVAAAGNQTLDQIRQSTNWGATWAVSSAPTNFSWGTVASSADGAKLVVAAFAGTGPIYASSNSGATWAPTSAPTNVWRSVASSGDGARLIAAWCNGYSSGELYNSTNAGASWSKVSDRVNPMNNQWLGVASSTDGTKLIAVAAIFLNDPAIVGDGSIYTSLKSGTLWARSSAPTNVWSCVASSADGTKLVAGSSDHYAGYIWGDGSIYTSSDSGATWARSSAPSNGWASVASSADGTRLVAATEVGDQIYSSSDSGLTWDSANAPAGEWQAVAISADGAAIVAVGWGLICTLHSLSATPPLLSIGQSGANIGFSWLVPSSGSFVLQKTSDLSSTNWLSTFLTPTLNFTNLRQELTLPRPSANTFYRLKQE